MTKIYHWACKNCSRSSNSFKEFFSCPNCGSKNIFKDVTEEKTNCSYCDNGYYQYEGNDIKCDHCKGLGKCLTNCEECKI